MRIRASFVVAIAVPLIGWAIPAWATWAEAPTVIATVPGGLGPFGLEVTPDGSQVFATNYFGNNVSIFDTSTKSEIAGSPLSVGTTPWDVAFSPDGTRAYVSNYQVPALGTTVSVIDRRVSPPVVISTVTVGTGPMGLTVSPDNGTVWVANYGSQSVTVLDTTVSPPVAAHTITGVGANPTAIDINPAGNRAIVVNYAPGSVSIINANTKAVVGALTFGSGLESVAYSRDGNRAFVSGGNQLHVLDTTADIPTLISTVTSPGASRLALSPDGTRVWVTNYFGTTVNIFDTNSSVAASGGPLSVGNAPVGIAITPNSKQAWIANFTSGTISVVDTGWSDAPPLGPLQYPKVASQAFSVPAQTTAKACAELAPDIVDWPGIGSLHQSGWSITYSQWPNDGKGGWVCTRQPYWTGSQWAMR